MICKNLLAIVFLAIALIACQPSGSSRNMVTSIQDDEAAIRQVYRQYVDKWNAADLDGVMKFMADDVVHMPPEQSANVGKETLRSRWEQFLSENTDIWKPTIEYIEVSGDLAIIRDSGTETTTPKVGGETTTSVDKGIHVFRRGTDGTWKMVIEIWNSNKLIE